MLRVKRESRSNEITLWYRGYQIGDRPPRWCKTPGMWGILVSKRAGKLGSFTPSREWVYPKGNIAKQTLAIAKAKAYIDGEIDGKVLSKKRGVK